MASPHYSARTGSALITVVMLIAMMAILTGSMLNYTLSERRGNERNRLILRSKNMAENVTLYSAEQISTKLHRMKTVNLMQFSSGTNRLYLPPDNVLTTAFSEVSDVATYAGITANTGLALITDTTSTNYGLQVLTGTVPIIAQSTMRHGALGSITTYAEQDLQISEVPLFQFAIFYNKDLEFSPGANMVISGPVHSNGDFIARCQTGFTNTIQFTDRVTAVGGFYANSAYKGTTYNESDSADIGPGGTGPLLFQNPAGTSTSIKSSASLWRDHKYGGSTVTTTSLANFKTFATSTYGGNFRTSAHQVGTLELPGLDTSILNSGRSTIEAPSSADSADLISAGTQFSRKAGLYIIVNPTALVRNGTLPDATTVSMRAYSYRCWLNTLNADLTHTIREVVLPGQPSYGSANAFVNNLPNAYCVNTAVDSNQVLRIPKGPISTANVDLADTGYATGTPSVTSFSDAYFYDLRRATNSNGHPFSRSSSPFLPRPIAKIDFDMTRFKMAVDRTYSTATTSTVYYPAKPRDATNWAYSIFNGGTPTRFAYGLGLGSAYSLFGSALALPVVQKSQAVAYAPAAIKISSTTQTGTAATATYAGRYIIQESTTVPPTAYVWGASTYTSSGDESSTTYTPGGSITAIKVTQYLAGGTTTQLDYQVIPIVTDGSTTTTATLTNDYMVIPSDASGLSTSSNFTTNPVVTEMRVYVGGVDDTANWTYTAAVTGGIVGTFGSGSLANIYTVTNMTISTTGTAVITAAKSGATSISKTFTLAKQKSITGAGTDQTGRWLTINGSPTTTPAPDPFRIYLAPTNSTEVADAIINPTNYEVTAANLYNAGTGPWFDGISVYIHSVDAEDLTMTTSPNRDRMDSGVRLWNGRGPVVSLSTVGSTGFSFCTNDPVYIVGHFNADGTINSTSTDATAYGGYSARYPDSSSEKLTAVMGDSLTIYSQPIFTSLSATAYYQSSGWSDSLSANICRTSGWSATWSTSNPSGSNSVDGTATATVPAYLPNLGNTGSPGRGFGGISGATTTKKFDPSVTEISACLLTGIVETTTRQNSGGVHNFPRLNEAWSGTGLYIRGSMIAMFASEIATEPWSIRIYSGAGRYWGLHQSLRSADHDVPLEPMLIGAARLAYKELTAAQYATMKATILALPIP